MTREVRARQRRTGRGRADSAALLVDSWSCVVAWFALAGCGLERETLARVELAFRRVSPRFERKVQASPYCSPSPVAYHCSA